MAEVEFPKRPRTLNWLDRRPLADEQGAEEVRRIPVERTVSERVEAELKRVEAELSGELSAVKIDLEDKMDGSGGVSLRKLESQLERQPLNEIAALMRALTYGEMMELSETLWNANAEGAPLNKDAMPGLLHRWSITRAP
jgi:hypothetical protein